MLHLWRLFAADMMNNGVVPRNEEALDERASGSARVKDEQPLKEDVGSSTEPDIGMWSDRFLNMQDVKKEDETPAVQNGNSHTGTSENGADNSANLLEGLADFPVIDDHELVLDNVGGIGLSTTSGVAASPWGLEPSCDGLDLGGNDNDGIKLGLMDGESKKEDIIEAPPNEVTQHAGPMKDEERAASVPLTGNERKASRVVAGYELSGQLSKRGPRRTMNAQAEERTAASCSLSRNTSDAAINSRRDEDLHALVRKLEHSIASLDVNARLCMRDALNSLSNKAAHPAMVPTPEQEAMNRAAEYLVLRMLFLCGPQVMHTAPGTVPHLVTQPSTPAVAPIPLNANVSRDVSAASQLVPNHMQPIAPSPLTQTHLQSPLIHQRQSFQRRQKHHTSQAIPLAPLPSKRPQQAVQTPVTPLMQQTQPEQTSTQKVEPLLQQNFGENERGR